MVRISKRQLASMIILFEVGSSPLFLLASEAKQDAWIAVSMAMLAGLALLRFVFLAIQKQEPDRNLVEISRRYMGPYLGYVFSGAFVLYFMYSSMRNVREFGDLTILYLLPGTPLGFIMFVLVFTTSYAVYKGVEVLFRVSEFLLPLVFLIYFLLFAAFAVTGLFKLERLLPVLNQDLLTIADAGLPEVISFPFGEVAVFLMFWKYSSDKKRLVSVSVLAYVLAGVFLVGTTVVLIAVLGPLAGTGGIPMMLAASMIELSRVVERMDPLVVLLLYTGVIMKQTLYFFGAVLAVSTMTRIPWRRLVFPMGVMLYLSSFAFRSLMQHVWVGFKLNTKYHFPIFTILLPIVLWLVMRIRGKPKPEQAK
ncbi:GerAB/ArcD/ProY family transporter [Gorillibacterium sp. sgz5001074]|uniref:GerAB/ArcD/ProY family transporter n=1 Tax=Gorillibacterium sp. sgz5001074 TaxID=3446695 RepID=UPI003F67FB2B